jgi:hypothetical protein
MLLEELMTPDVEDVPLLFVEADRFLPVGSVMGEENVRPDDLPVPKTSKLPVG